MNRQYAGIFDCRACIPGGQGHNAVEGGLGWDEIAEDRQRPADPNQSTFATWHFAKLLSVSMKKLSI